MNRNRKAKHSPNEVEWHPVTKREIVQTSRGPVPVTPDEDVIIREGDDVWVNKLGDYLRRYGDSMDEDARAEFEKYYPGAFG